MKKSIWIILPIVIVAVVLVAVFVGQRNSLSDQLAQLQAERSELSRQLSEADVAAKTSQDMADSSRTAMEEKVQEAETKIQEAEAKVQEAEGRAVEAEARIQEAEGKAQEAIEALSLATTERDALQANAAAAAEQLAASIKQAQDVLGVLGVSQDDAAKELEETKAALADVIAERDALLESITYISASILDASGSVVAAFDSITDLNLDELSLESGEYTICLKVLNAADEEIGHYDFPYAVAAAE